MSTNKWIKSIVGAFVMVMAFTVTASAQDRTADGAKKITDKMKTDLVLTDAQYKQVYDANLDFLTKAKAEKDAAKSAAQESGNKIQKGTKGEKGKAIKSLADARDAKLKTILTADQYKKFEADKEANKDKMKEMVKEKKAKQ